MYAVIRTGGKQYRVTQGQRLDVELLGGARHSDDSDEIGFDPVLVVDGSSVTAGTAGLAGARVTARVVGESSGPKIRGYTYKNKSNQRRNWGHRQKYNTIEITGITSGG